MPTSADLFTAVGLFLQKNPEQAAKVQTVFQWKLTSPESSWILDAKNGAGSCAAGVDAKADVTLELADADFLAMCTGQADPQKLYFGGKLKISGNVMASQKLGFLKKLDPALVVEAMKQRGGAAGAAGHSTAAAAAAAPAARTAAAEALFRALGERLKQNPSLAKEVGQVLQFKIKDPDRAFVVDLTGAGAVREGTEAKAAATFTLTDVDLASLAKKDANARDLFQHGKLRVDGDLQLAHKLSFLNGLA
jgi:3-hydroxyacyl-CoA dehydrogenase/3a,7a,12a-trihydroxy-5b-cholest-24-enoyl-CoA hydratase